MMRGARERREGGERRRRTHRAIVSRRVATRVAPPLGPPTARARALGPTPFVSPRHLLSFPRFLALSSLSTYAAEGRRGVSLQPPQKLRQFHLQRAPHGGVRVPNGRNRELHEQAERCSAPRWEPAVPPDSRGQSPPVLAPRGRATRVSARRRNTLETVGDLLGERRLFGVSRAGLGVATNARTSATVTSRGRARVCSRG